MHLGRVMLVMLIKRSALSHPVANSCLAIACMAAWQGQENMDVLGAWSEYERALNSEKQLMYRNLLV